MAVQTRYLFILSLVVYTVTTYMYSSILVYAMSFHTTSQEDPSGLDTFPGNFPNNVYTYMYTCLPHKLKEGLKE